MPVKSQAQRRFMYAAEKGKVPGVAKSVGADFINASHGVKGLPEHVRHSDAPGAHFLSVAKRPHIVKPNYVARAKRPGGDG